MNDSMNLDSMIDNLQGLNKILTVDEKLSLKVLEEISDNRRDNFTRECIEQRIIELMELDKELLD